MQKKLSLGYGTFFLSTQGALKLCGAKLTWQTLKEKNKSM